MSVLVDQSYSESLIPPPDNTEPNSSSLSRCGLCCCRCFFTFTVIFSTALLVIGGVLVYLGKDEIPKLVEDHPDGDFPLKYEASFVARVKNYIP